MNTLLLQYEGKNIVLETKSGRIYRGVVGDYCYPDDNENGEESIIIDAIGYGNPMEFYANEIKSIDVIV